MSRTVSPIPSTMRQRMNKEVYIRAMEAQARKQHPEAMDKAKDGAVELVDSVDELELAIRVAELNISLQTMQVGMTFVGTNGDPLKIIEMLTKLGNAQFTEIDVHPPTHLVEAIAKEMDNLYGEFQWMKGLPNLGATAKQSLEWLESQQKASGVILAQCYARDDGMAEHMTATVQKLKPHLLVVN